jgi:hypothetical protein
MAEEASTTGIVELAILFPPTINDIVDRCLQRSAEQLYVISLHPHIRSVESQPSPDLQARKQLESLTYYERKEGPDQDPTWIIYAISTQPHRSRLRNAEP